MNKNSLFLNTTLFQGKELFLNRNVPSSFYCFDPLDNHKMNNWNPFRPFVLQLVDLSGLDSASVKTLLCLFLSFPISAIFKRLPDSNYRLKNFYIIGASIIYIFFILEIIKGFFVILANALFTYILTRYYKSRFMPWVNLIVLMGVLCINHIYQQFTLIKLNPGEIDYTGAQMVMVMKLSAFGWSYWDGQLFKNDKQKFENELNTYQKSRAIVNHPKLISYLGYVFFYASFVTGPSFDYADYEKFILTDLFDDVPESKKPGKSRKRKIPKSGRVALKKVLQGFFWIGMFVYLTPRITLDYAFSDKFRYTTFGYKLIFMYVLGLTYRLKYYAVWLISEGACIVVGLGYNGYDPVKDKMYWNRVQNIDPVKFELGQNVHDCLEAWNMNTNKWLKNFIYLRTCTRDKNTGKLKAGLIPTIITFATSAFWHGTRPGYYLTFILGAFLQSVGKIFRRNIRPIFISKDGSNVSKFKIYYDIVSLFLTQMAFGYTVQPFVILEFRPSLELWKMCYFWAHVGAAVVFLLFDGPFRKQVVSFFAKYHIPNKTTEPIVKDENDIPIAVKLAHLKDQFDSTTDLLEVFKNSEKKIELPDFDNQEELKENNVIKFDMLEEDFTKLAKEFEEWKEQIWQGKNTHQITDDEFNRIKAALSNFENDLMNYVQPKKQD